MVVVTGCGDCCTNSGVLPHSRISISKSMSELSKSEVPALEDLVVTEGEGLWSLISFSF